MTNLKIKLGKRIKTLRKNKGLTQEKLAEIINLDITSLSKIETGRNYPLPETLEKISAALDTDIEKLFSFKQELSQSDYIEAINKNVLFLQNNREKLKLLYLISSALV